MKSENEKPKAELEKRDDRQKKVEDRLQKIVLPLGIDVQGFKARANKLARILIRE